MLRPTISQTAASAAQTIQTNPATEANAAASLAKNPIAPPSEFDHRLFSFMFCSSVSSFGVGQERAACSFSSAP